MVFLRKLRLLYLCWFLGVSRAIEVANNVVRMRERVFDVRYCVGVQFYEVFCTKSWKRTDEIA